MNLKYLQIFIFIILPCVVKSQTAAPKQVIENLIFEGAGIRGIAYCGALMELDELGYLAEVKRVGGTSSGAITASLLSVGFTPGEIYQIIGTTDFGKFNDGKLGFIGGIYRTKKYLGWYKGDRFLQWLEELITQKIGSADITFKELSNQAKTSTQFKELLIAATSLNHQQTILFDVQTYPEMRIADAVRASMAVPLYFEPVIINHRGQVVEQKHMKKSDHICVDGGFIANFCIQAYDNKSATDGLKTGATLGLRIDSNEQINNDKGDKSLAYQGIRSPADFIKALYYITKETMNRQPLTEEDWQRTVSISDSDIGPKVKKLSEKQKQKLISSGRTGVKIYFEKHR